MTDLKITIASQAKNICKYKTQKGKYLIDFVLTVFYSFIVEY
jgi:hypothetical protein